MGDGGKALVIGGGIGGLATALALGRAGYEVEVFERAPALQEVGAGIALWANGLLALDRLGVGDAVRSAGLVHDGGAIRSASGEVLMELSSPRDAAPGHGLGCMIHRADLLATLAAAVGPGVVRTGKRFRGYSEQDGEVTALFEDGTEAKGAFLVGADGIHSRVRAALGYHAEPRYAGYTIWRWVAALSADRTLPGETWGSGARFGHAALPHGRVYVFATADAPPGGRGRHGETPELERIFGGWHAPIPELVAGADESAILRNDCYDIRPLRSWGRGRCTLLGDAAHAMTPNLGQGACQALEDAVILARWLEAERNPEPALRGYERERRSRTARFQIRSRAAGALGQWAHPLAVGARAVLARRVLSRLQGAQMKELMGVAL